MTAPDLTSAHLRERYGTPSPWGRRAVIAVAALAVLSFGAWLAWSTYAHATPQVTSELVRFSVDGEHAAVATVAVEVSDGVDPQSARCLVRAYAEDHSTVGELTFTPGGGTGRYDETIRTERVATSVESVGCTTPDQNRPR